MAGLTVWLLRLYPRAWRRRYGEEYAALLDQMRLTPRLLLDALIGAADAHVHPRATVPNAVPPANVPLVAAVGPGPPVDDPSPVPRRAPRVREWESVMDRIIREAQERGEFDNLPGAGRPLDLGEENPFAAEWELAFHVVKRAGETLPWIALGKEVAEGEERLHGWLAATADRLARLRSGLVTVADARRYENERAEARERYLTEAVALDRKLLDYNAQVPSFLLDRGRLPPHIAAERFDRACPPAPAR